MNRIEALKLLEELLEAGFVIGTKGDRLTVAPRERITDPLRERIQKAKPKLLELLDPPTPDAPCPDCGWPSFARKEFGRWRCVGCDPLPAGEALEFVAGALADYPDRQEAGTERTEGNP